MRRLITLSSLLALLAGPVQAASNALIEAVQAPAWLIREGLSKPLQPGMTLGNKDQIKTGPEARVIVRLGEGSQVKLGANAVLNLDGFAANEQQRNVFQSSLDVVQGAFRFTTSLASRIQRRDINIRVATVTAGIRGTDLWGKAAIDKDIVCLLEGKIAVQREQETPFVMDQPRSFYIAPKNAPALPVSQVSEAQFAQWELETDPAPGQGLIRQGGKHRLQSAPLDTQKAALVLFDQLQAAGYHAKIQPRAGKFRVIIPQLASRDDARHLSAKLQKQLNIQLTP
jgi:hypothetical protein